MTYSDWMLNWSQQRRRDRAIWFEGKSNSSFGDTDRKFLFEGLKLIIKFIQKIYCSLFCLRKPFQTWLSSIVYYVKDCTRRRTKQIRKLLSHVHEIAGEVLTRGRNQHIQIENRTNIIGENSASGNTKHLIPFLSSNLDMQVLERSIFDRLPIEPVKQKRLLGPEYMTRFRLQWIV